ncbi:MAG: hypothetical protein IJT88_00415 [Kiritimatiellae bacterium]|nr:hypothetical protein [Kiritimatiellia bacterium]
MDAEVLKTRNEIVRKFCRTIVWIDDGINLQEGLTVRKPQDSPLFLEKLKEFSAAGLLCHLQGFPQVEDSEEDDPFSSEVGNEVEKCAKLALQSDIVIVDWMLGSVDSSKYAQEIVKRLLGDKQGFRFIVILSQKPPERGFPGILDSTFASIAGVDGLWKNKTGQFLLSLRKDDFANTSLFDCICKALQRVYPDYLHLAALEIAGRIKELTPNWFSAIPSDSDYGLLIDRANKMATKATAETWQKDIQDCVVSNLLEDLTSIILGDSLKSLREDVLRPSNNLEGEIAGSVAFEDVSLTNAVKGCLKDVEPTRLTKGPYQQLRVSSQSPVAKKIIRGVESFTEFCETQSAILHSGPKIMPGAIYSELDGDDGNILVCIAAACDCERGKAKKLLCLRGMPLLDKTENGRFVSCYDQIGMVAGGRMVLRFSGKSYVFRFETESLVLKPKAELVDKIPQGAFRRDIVNRLASRYLNYVRRVGVNQPELSRNLRKEEIDE